ncbi:MAG: T9SS type A sorting domain-containing protein, partial [Saprospiraceae bacterium]|nr:T9SS type A sorting domain-containing protein [Saprospiraceae bacterium]
VEQFNYDQFVSAQEPLTLDFSIFPNPASHLLQVKGADLNKTLLYDASGQVVLSQKFSGQELLQLPVAHLPGGIYQLQVFDQTGRVGVKPVVIGH